MGPDRAFCSGSQANGVGKLSAVVVEDEDICLMGVDLRGEDASSVRKKDEKPQIVI
jgi:hypothetical protein